jgi:large subunit ribosomal protein L28
MSRTCPITGKKPMYGNNRSHSLRATRRRWNVNLQKTTMMIDGKKTTLRISTAALRTLRKNKKLVKPEIPAQKAPVAQPVAAPAPEAVKPAEVKPAEEKKAEAAPAVAEKKEEAKPVAKKAAAKKPAAKKAVKAEKKPEEK